MELTFSDVSKPKTEVDLAQCVFPITQQAIQCFNGPDEWLYNFIVHRSKTVKLAQFLLNVKVLNKDA